MGNQTSKVLEKTRDKKNSKARRRRSTITLGTSNLTITSNANYDWIDESMPPPDTRRQSITEFFYGKRKTTVPDDSKEIDRLQRQHYLLKSVRKTNSSIKIIDSMKVVDVGTGNGIWALEIAAENPNCKVIGIDIKPPNEQPGKPSNLSFQTFDITQPWPIESNSVDYIFQRNMGPDIMKDQWKDVFQEIYRVLKPGGTVELVELDLCHHHPGPVQRAFDDFNSTQCDEDHIDFYFTKQLQHYVESTGFIELNHKTLDIPIGEWPEEPEMKRIGFINKEIRKASFRNKKNFYLVKWGISAEDYELAVQEVLNEFDEYHGFSRFHCWLAKKPN